MGDAQLTPEQTKIIKSILMPVIPLAGVPILLHWLGVVPKYVADIAAFIGGFVIITVGSAGAILAFRNERRQLRARRQRPTSMWHCASCGADNDSALEKCAFCNAVRPPALSNEEHISHNS